MAAFRASFVTVLSLFACVVFACSDDTATDNPTTPNNTKDGGGGRTDSGSSGGGGDRDGGGGTKTDAGPVGKANLRVLAGNITSGNSQKYDPGEGIRMFQGLRPDLALIQEMNYKTNSNDDIKELVTTAFGDGFSYYRESGSGIQIPNGIASRFPIAESGHWTDPNVGNRGFAWAKITVPGSHPLWAVSVHLLTTGSSDRTAEATALVGELKKVVGQGDYIVIGGDLNTDGRNETCLSTLGELTNTKGPYPADGKNNENTNAPRSKPYDWVLASPDLAARQVPTVIGSNSFAAGLVFDSRVYTPLEDVAPVQAGDSAAENMQHMPVVKDFSL